MAFHENVPPSELNAIACVSGLPGDEFTAPVSSTPPGDAERVPAVEALPRSNTTATVSVFDAPGLCTEMYPTYSPGARPLVLTDTTIGDGVTPLVPAVSQFSPDVTVVVVVNGTLAPKLVVTGSDCGAIELPVKPRNSSAGSAEIRLGSAATFRTTGTLPGGTPGPLKAILPRYCPAARPDGLRPTVSVDSALPEPELPDAGETVSQGFPLPAVALQLIVAVPPFATSIARETGTIDPTAAFTTRAAGDSVNCAGIAAVTERFTATLCCRPPAVTVIVL